MVEVKEPLNEKHHQKSTEQPPGRAVDGMQLMPGMRQKVQDADAEHQAGDKARCHLQPSVRQPDEQWNPPARQRSQQDRSAIPGYQDHRRK